MNLKTFIKPLIANLTIFGFAVMAAACGPQTNIDPALIGTEINQVGTETRLRSLIAESQEGYYTGGPLAETTSQDANTPTAGSKDDRDVTGTNVQVEGVDEGDIVKTDGYQIYYAPRYMNRIHVFEVDDAHVINYQSEIALGDIYTDSLYLLDDYLVIVGYTFDNMVGGGCPVAEDDGDVGCMAYMWWSPTGTVVVIDRLTLEIVYQMKTDSNFLDHRMIEDSLFLVGHKYLYYYQTEGELRPTFEVTGSVEPEYVSYDNIYYYDDTPVNGMTVLTGIKFNADSSKISYTASAYLGAGYSYKQLYVSLTDLYIADTNWIYDQTSYGQTMTISQFSLDVALAKATFVGATIVEGGMLNQFSMDEYQGYLRVATTYQGATWKVINSYEWGEYERVIKNHLYILKIDVEAQAFELMAHLEEGLGKPGESIQSVRFLGDQAYIVTFLITDPLYIIDLSDPKNPKISDEIHLPGYDTYQHPWGANYLLGIGYQADDQGMVEGMKLTAYNTTSGSASVLQTYELSVEKTVPQAQWTYSYSEALWNHKAMLVSVEHGVFGFPVQAYEYGWTESDLATEGQDWYSSYHSYYYLFRIDFSQASPIATPIVIEHSANEQYYVNVDRAVMIDGFVYTLSDRQAITYDLNTSTLVTPALTYPTTM